jgi:uncharacterized RDD family membrane protein YckC/Tfp pilus assembly protein PilE
MSEDTKACPMCGETILAVAIKCKHCGSIIGNVGALGAQSSSMSQFAELSEGHHNPDEIIFAGFWSRFAAVWLDGFVIYAFLIVIGIVVFILGKVLNISVSANSATFLFYVLYFGISAFYFSIMESGSKSASYGKRWLGLMVVDVKGNRISGGRAFARWISHFFSYLTLYIGFFMQPFTSKKQALHDMMSGTIVIENKNSKSSSVIVIAIIIFVIGTAFFGILAAVAIPAYQDYITKAKAAKIAEQQNIERAKEEEQQRTEQSKMQEEAKKLAEANSNNDAQLSAIASETNKSLPMMVDKETRLDATYGASNEFVYKYTLVNILGKSIPESRLKSAMEKKITNTVCTTKQTYDDFIAKGITVSYTYYGKDGTLIGTISVSPSQCDSKKGVVM